VINGDECTTLDFGKLYAYHQEMQADLTVAVQEKTSISSYGILEMSNGRITNYCEKPTSIFWVSMGIYVLNNEVLDVIPDDQRFDMPELVQGLLKRKAKVTGFESQDIWFDIGTLEDLDKARQVAGTEEFGFGGKGSL